MPVRIRACETTDVRALPLGDLHVYTRKLRQRRTDAYAISVDMLRTHVYTSNRGRCLIVSFSADVSCYEREKIRSVAAAAARCCVLTSIHGKKGYSTPKCS